MLSDLYVRRSGWLHRLDPRTKIALTLAGAVLFVVLESTAGLLLVLAGIHVLLFTSRVPARHVWWVWRQLLRVLLIIVLLWPLFAGLPGTPLVVVGPFVVTTNSVLAGIATAVRVVGMSLLFFVVLFTTEQNHLVHGLVRLGLPFDWGLTIAIALRYVPTFTRLVEQVQEAQAARAWHASRGDVVRRLRGTIPVFVAFIIGVLRTSDTLGMALAARGVGRGGPRTSRIQLQLQALDWLVLAVALVGTAGVLWMCLR